YPDDSAIVELLESKGVDYVDWEGYHRVETAEKALGEAEGRERVKIATREGMLAEARSHLQAEAASQPASGH
ncbi:MAG: pyridine nucleotide-disulfide oxidoreductase, partial [Brevibacterium aurantiacum]|nr:pyridine nucleotide-disulfide oxidoreductase [Brevibacterium aurantiacum]